MKIDAEWIAKAVEVISNKIANRLEKDNITVYRCGTVIRIDIKGV